MAGPRRSRVNDAFGDGQVFKERPKLLERFVVSAHHETRAVPRARDAAAGPDIDKYQAPLAQLLVPAYRILPMRVAGIGDNVAFLEKGRQVLNHLFSGV